MPTKLEVQLYSTFTHDPFLKISLKALQRFTTAAILNLLGLALAFTAFLVIVLHTWNEYNYDNYHPNKEHIFKVEFLRDNNTWEDGYARVLFEHLFSGSPQSTGLRYFSWITHLGRGCAMSPGARPGELVMCHEKVDPHYAQFTDVIHFDILEGNVKAIADPDQVLIPESVARKFFGEESAVGKPIVLLDRR
ncbi:MAG: ABC transporter permease [Alistipes indistinctus]